MASTKSMKVNVGVKVVRALSRQPGLEVVPVRCDVDEEALEALRKQSQEETGNECVYKQVYM